MPYYSLESVATPGVCVHVVAVDRAEAVAEFGENLGRKLTLEDPGHPPLYMMAEHHEAEAHWIKPEIPVFEED